MIVDHVKMWFAVNFIINFLSPYADFESYEQSYEIGCYLSITTMKPDTCLIIYLSIYFLIYLFVYSLIYLLERFPMISLLFV